MQFPIAARFGGVEVLHFRYVHGRGAPGYTLDRHSVDDRGVRKPSDGGRLRTRLATPPAPATPQAPVVVHALARWSAAPAVSQLMRWLGYTLLPERPFPATPVTLRPFDQAPFYGSVMTYRAATAPSPAGRKSTTAMPVSASGRGPCGVPLDQLKDSAGLSMDP